MADLAHVVGSDLQLGPCGDLLLVDAASEVQQRILRRLLTGPGSYIWQLSYGAGLPLLVGSTVSQQQIAAIVRAQLAHEASVAPVPEATVSLIAGPGGQVSATVTYADNNSGVSQSLTFLIGG